MNIRLKKQEQIKILCADDIYGIMQRVLLRENKIDRNREHFWTMSLDIANRILNIEMVSMGSVRKTIAEPMEVFSVPLQKRAVKIVLIHNHPSGELEPSAADKDLTNLLIQCGLIMHVPVLDHLIITEKEFFSFVQSGLMDELLLSTKYVPDYKLKEKLKKQVKEEVTKTVEERKARAMAKAMKQNKEPLEKIIRYTGLTKKIIEKIKTE